MGHWLYTIPDDDCEKLGDDADITEKRQLDGKQDAQLKDRRYLNSDSRFIAKEAHTTCSFVGRTLITNVSSESYNIYRVICKPTVSRTEAVCTLGCQEHAWSGLFASQYR